MGEQGFASSKEALRTIMQTTMKQEKQAEEQAEYQAEYQDVKVVLHTEISASVYAKITLKKICKEQTSLSRFIQLLTLVFREGDWYICATYAIPQGLTEESIETYPMAFADQTLKQLRAELRDSTFELMNASLSGGIFGVYVVDGKYPLYFLNDSVARMLGYSKEEFENTFREDLSEVIYQEDKEYVKYHLERRIPEEEDYTLRFRLRKKDGSLVWIIEHGRQTIDKEGRRVLISVVTDISDIVELQNNLEDKTALLEEQADELTAQNEELQMQSDSIAEQARRIAVSEERFRIALQNTSNIIFEYDLIHNTILYTDLTDGAKDIVISREAAGNHFLADGTLTEDSVREIQHILNQIQEGALQKDCIVQAKNIQGEVGWYRISLTGIPDEHAVVTRAVGLIADITRQREAEIANEQEEQYHQAVLADVMATYTINFSKDIFESCQVHDVRCEEVPPNTPYQAYMEQVSLKRMSEHDRSAFLNTLTKGSVLDAFEQGKKELEVEYQVLNPDGTNVWMKDILRLLTDSTTRERKGYLYVKNVDNDKKKSLALQQKAERDSLTGVYNKGATQKYISEKLATLDGIKTGVMMILDIDHFKKVNDTYGHLFGDEVLQQIGDILRNYARATDIVGRIGGDEFCAFFRGIRTHQSVKALAKTICSQVEQIQTPMPGGITLSCSIGITVCDGEQKTFEQVYKEADDALYVVKGAGRNGTAFYEDGK